jgi:hypothetical protein
MVVVYHWAANDGEHRSLRIEVADEITSITLGLMWPIVWFCMALYSIIPAIKYVEQLIYKKK